MDSAASEVDLAAVQADLEAAREDSVAVKAVKAVKAGWKVGELVRLLARSWTNKMAVSRSKPSRGLCRFQLTTTQSSLKPAREPLPTSKQGCESQ